ncbi:YceI family protein [Aureimonas psammosilenae]|uniref:YceI family protein n=1 Tax=Aureimonas psammosilenae TaxID=2495496 RepID=UPI001260E52C|nr:YceI family protein [Aureimonas psammosilenae]
MSLLKSLAVAGALLAGLSAASAQTISVPSGTYKADPAHTNVLWTVSHFGLSNYIGRFRTIAATLDLDASDPTKSKLTATIDPASVDTNYPGKDKDFNAEIASPMFLDAAKFGKIEFVSNKIETTGDNTGKVTGDLTLHGVTKPVVLDVKLNAQLNPHPMSKKPAIGFSATGTIKRSEFGIATLVGPVADDVKLTIESEFVPQ